MEKRISSNILEKSNQFLNLLGYQLSYKEFYNCLELKDLNGNHIAFESHDHMHINNNGILGGVDVISNNGTIRVRYQMFGSTQIFINVGFDEKTGNINHLSFSYKPYKNGEWYKLSSSYEFSQSVSKDKRSLGMNVYQVGDRNQEYIFDIPVDWKILDVNNRQVDGEHKILYIHNENGSLYEVCNFISMDSKTFDIKDEKGNYIMQEVTSTRKKGKEREKVKRRKVDSLDKYVEGILATDWTKQMFFDLCQFIESNTPGIINCFYNLFPDFKATWDFIVYSQPRPDFAISDEKLSVNLNTERTDDTSKTRSDKLRKMINPIKVQ